MKATEAFIAADFGGGSGRVIAGTVGPSGAIELHEIHRFANRQVRLGKHIYWDFPALFAEMLEGIRKAVDYGYHIKSIGIDTWGVDFGLLDRRGNLLSLPVCYRDEISTVNASDDYFASHSRSSHYSEAGIQIMDINTIYRLVRMADTAPDLLEAADKMLFMPDLFSYFLTGEANVEYTIATTSELIDAKSRSWNTSLIHRLSLPERLFPALVMPGNIRGYLTENISKHLGISYPVPVVAVASHDTASAAAVCPAYTDNASAFLSSGTWSLLGVTIDDPILSEEARLQGFTNEGATNRRITFLQNITGLWILQRLMDEWRREDASLDYSQLTREAEASSYSAIINVDDPRFSNGGTDMEKAIRSSLEHNGAEAPVSRGDIVLCVLTSLATRYAKAIEGLNSILPRPIKCLHIIGGGSKNTLLNTLTQNAIGLPVYAGPAEATALGNILIQARAAGLNPSIS